MLEDVINRLNSLGVKTSSEQNNADVTMIAFAIDKITNHIKNQTNLNKVPNGLHEIAVDMVVGEFLFTKKAFGQLDIETLDFGLVTKAIQEGDSNVTFAVDANTTPEAKFEALLNYLRHNEVDFVRYRVMTW